MPKTERPAVARALASAGSLPCNVQAHRLMTVSPANPAATDTSPTRIKTARPPFFHRAAHPPACRVPNQCPIENANCGKVGAVREEITVSMWPFGNTLLTIVFGNRNFPRRAGPQTLRGPADTPGAVLHSAGNGASSMLSASPPSWEGTMPTSSDS